MYCGTQFGTVYMITSSGNLENTFLHDYAPNNTGTVAWDIGNNFYGVYNDTANDKFNNYVSDTSQLISNSTSPVTSVAKNYLDTYFYYYNELTELWRTGGTLASTTNMAPTFAKTLNSQTSQTSQTVFNPILFLLGAACIHSSLSLIHI